MTEEKCKDFHEKKPIRNTKVEKREEKKEKIGKRKKFRKIGRKLAKKKKTWKKKTENRRKRLGLIDSGGCIYSMRIERCHRIYRNINKYNNINTV